MKIRSLASLMFCGFLYTGFSQTFYSGMQDTPIPDDAGSMELSIDVAGLADEMNQNFGIESICLDLRHTNDAQLIIYLISPNGTTVEITTNNGNSANYIETCFNMNAADFITSSTSGSPFTGAFRPEGDLSKFNHGQNPNGKWKLYVLDDVPNSCTGVFKHWSIHFSNTPAIPFPFESSNLPILNISTNSKTIADDVKITVDMEIINNQNQRNRLNDPLNYKGIAGIEFRGSSSQRFPKKSYSLTTMDNIGNNLDTSLLDLPSENDWVMHGPYTDKTLMRNVLTYKLSRDMGHYAPRTKYFELFINNQYQGVYVLIEKIKRGKNSVNISKLDSLDNSADDLTGGYIIKIDRINGSGGDGWFSKYSSSSIGDTAVYFQYEYPNQDKITTQQKKYIQAYVDSFENALSEPDFTTPSGDYRKFISVTSFFDNFILNEISKNIDGYRLSTFLYKDRKSKGGKLKNGPIWDFDIAWDNANFNGGNDPTGWQYQWQPFEYMVPFWWAKFMKDAGFVNELRCRYQYLRRSILDTIRINRFIDSTANYLEESQNRNFNYYPIIGTYIWPNPTPVPTSYREEITVFKNWIGKRIEWMDNNLPGNCSTAIVDQANYKNNFQCFPNPFSSSIDLNYSLDRDALVQIELINLLGITAKEQSQFQIVGSYRQKINTESLAGGVYMLKLTIDNQAFYQKVMKIDR